MRRAAAAAAVVSVYIAACLAESFFDYAYSCSYRFAAAAVGVVVVACSTVCTFFAVVVVVVVVVDVALTCFVRHTTDSCLVFCYCCSIFSDRCCSLLSDLFADSFLVYSLLVVVDVVVVVVVYMAIFVCIVAVEAVVFFFLVCRVFVVGVASSYRVLIVAIDSRTRLDRAYFSSAIVYKLLCVSCRSCFSTSFYDTIWQR